MASRSGTRRSGLTFFDVRSTETVRFYLYAIAALDGPARCSTSKRLNPISQHHFSKSAAELPECGEEIECDCSQQDLGIPEANAVWRIASGVGEDVFTVSM